MLTIEDIRRLSDEFPRDVISWRAQNMTRDGDKALALAYIDARDVMNRLDEMCSPENWQDRYEFHGSRTVCYLSIRVGNEWIAKADGAGDSDFEAEKGAISDSLKRAAVKWGIGRYLYDIESPWVPCEFYEKDGKKFWKKWQASPWDYIRGAPRPAAAKAKQPEPVKPAAKPRIQQVAGDGPEYVRLDRIMRSKKTVADLANWWRTPTCKAEREKMPDHLVTKLHDAFVKYGYELKDAEGAYPGSFAEAAE
jgi:hypothetical protein